MATNTSVNSPLSGTTGTGNFVGSTSPAITTPSLGTLNDTSGNAALQFIPSAGGSWVTLQNTSSPQLQAAGSASNIILYLKSKGDAAVSFVTSAVSARPIEIYSGTAGQHLTQFAFSNTAASRVVTFPDLSGTVALSGASQTVTFNGVTAGITATASSLNQSASNTTFTGTGVLSQQFIPNSTSYSELAGYDFATSGGATPYARIAAYKTGAGSIIKMGTSNNYGSGITNTAVTIDQSGVVTLSSALPVSSGGTGVTSATAYAVLCGGTTSTGALQSVASVGTSNQLLASNGAGALPTFKTLNTLTTAPTITTYTSGSGTYTTPAGVKYLVVELVGGGGGGAGSGAGAGNGSNGGNTTFGTATANGGNAGLPSGGTGGTASGGTINLQGGMGGFGGGNSVPGALGGSSYFAGGGAGGNNAAGNASNAPANTGAGGGGAGGSATVQGAYAGGAGGYVRWVISSPSATYSYGVGAGGAGGAAGTSGGAGGSGAAGLIIVTEYYQ